jgi:hypothetical protein
VRWLLDAEVFDAFRAPLRTAVLSISPARLRGIGFVARRGGGLSEDEDSKGDRLRLLVGACGALSREGTPRLTDAVIDLLAICLSVYKGHVLPSRSFAVALVSMNRSSFVINRPSATLAQILRF